MNMIVIEWQRLVYDSDKTCPRCGATEQEIEKAVQNLKQLLNSAGLDVCLVKKAIDPERFKEGVLESNKILIAGQTLEEWIGAETGQSPCCEVCGDAECRTVEYGNQSHETVPADLIVKAGLLAASQVFDVQLTRADAENDKIKKQIFRMKP